MSSIKGLYIDKAWYSEGPPLSKSITWLAAFTKATSHQAPFLRDDGKVKSVLRQYYCILLIDKT